MLVTALASVRFCFVQSLSVCSVMVPAACSSGELEQVWQLCLFSCEAFQRRASPAHLYGEISYCAFISLFCNNNKKATRQETDWLNVTCGDDGEEISSLFSFYASAHSVGTLSKVHTRQTFSTMCTGSRGLRGNHKYINDKKIIQVPNYSTQKKAEKMCMWCIIINGGSYDDGKSKSISVWPNIQVPHMWM